jgi:hypothetical protein
MGGAIPVAIVSVVTSSHTTAVGGGVADGILATMRPMLAIPIAVAATGAVQLVALLRVGTVRGTAEVVPVETETAHRRALGQRSGRQICALAGVQEIT